MTMDIKIRNRVIESLFTYEPKLNKWHEEKHLLTYESCNHFIKEILEPIKKEIQKEEREARDKNRYSFLDDERIIKAKESCKRLIGIIRACRSSLRYNGNYQIGLSFVEEV